MSLMEASQFLIKLKYDDFTGVTSNDDGISESLS